MPVLKCPACGASGEIRQSEETFSVRGQWPEGHWPVLRCNQCGTGLIVKPRVFPPGAKATVIPSSTWERMEQMWADAFDEDDDDEITTYAGVSVGDRVELVTSDDVTEVALGSRGTVEEISVMSSALGTWIGVRWADGEFSNVFPDDGAVLRVVRD